MVTATMSEWEMQKNEIAPPNSPIVITGRVYSGKQIDIDPKRKCKTNKMSTFSGRGSSSRVSIKNNSMNNSFCLESVNFHSI